MINPHRIVLTVFLDLKEEHFYNFPTFIEIKNKPMKKYILAASVLCHLTCFSQEMKFEMGKLYFDNVQITTQLAKDRSATVSMDAFTSFKKAGVIRGWNVFWVIFGGYELGVGAYNTAAGYTSGLIDIGIGGLAVGIVPTREAKRRMWIADGVKKYNLTISKQ